MSYSKRTNPFYDDDDDYSFGNVGRDRTAGYGNRGNSYGQFGGEEEDPVLSRRAQLQQEISESKERQMDSQQRALASLYESERMGVATAEELVRQGEQLDNVERKTDEINASMKTAQKHINNIRSVFGGIKNWFSGNKQEEKDTGPPKRESGLRSVVENSENNMQDVPHPVMRRWDDDRCRDEVDSTQAMRRTDDRYEEQFNKNLGAMSDNLTRLKGLGMAMTVEIGDQNDQIDRINYKVDKADTDVFDKTKQINRQLHR